MKKSNEYTDNCIGIISQISDDISLKIILDNNSKCNISDIIAVKTIDGYVLAKISDIKIDYYLENATQYFISKAVENNLQKVINNSPRFGQIATGIILGHYSFKENKFQEINSRINRYTPKILQSVYLLKTDLCFAVYGLADHFLNSENIIFDLGYQAYPLPDKNEPVKLFFYTNTFKKHTLITGVTGSGKSRLAVLLARQLARLGGHISILDPHDEYSFLLKSEGLPVHKFVSSDKWDKQVENNNLQISKINFFDGILDAHTLTKLFPYLSPQQESLVYEIFNTIGEENFNIISFVNSLVKELNTELKKESLKTQENISVMQKTSEKIATNTIEFLKYYINGLRQMRDLEKSSRSGVLIAIIGKINELRETNLISSFEPNWLKKSPKTIDIFNIDYSANEYIRRYINSIIQFFLRKKTKDETRVFIIDEAHMLLKDNVATISILKQLLREGRKYGISVIFISQNRNDVPDDIKSQFQNHFAFREAQTETSYFADQVCHVALFGSKSTFAMRVKTIHLVAD